MKTPPLRMIVTLVLAGTLIAACGINPDSAGVPTPTPSIEPPTALIPTSTTLIPTPTAQESPIELERCVVGMVAAECATYWVYEDRAARSGRMLELRIAVMPAWGEKHEADPFFYLTGGPGGSAVDALPGIAPAFKALNEHRDLVFVDQRGTGGSNRLLCPQPPDTLSAGDVAAMTAYAESCLAALDVDAGWYTTRAFVDDLDEIRAALGYERINIAGGSYGATAAQVYLLHHEQQVRTMTMMGGTLLDVPIFERLAWSSQRALDMVFARCTADAACGATFPHVQAEFEAGLARIAQQPVATGVIDPQTGDPITVTRDLFTSVVHGLLMGADGAAQLPRLVHQAYKGNWQRVASEAANRILAHSGDNARLLMGAVIRCGEPWAVDDPDEVRRTGTGSYLVDGQIAGAENMAQVCPVVPRPEPGATYGPTQRSMAPVLLLSGLEDPQNPPENVADLQKIYPNGRALFEPYRSHYTVDWSCIAPTITAFVELGTVDGLQAGCLSKVKPYPFDVRP